MVEKSVDSVFADWAETVGETVKAERQSKESGAPIVPAPTFDASEIEPLILSLGNMACHMFGVQEIDDSDARDVARAAAPVVSKYIGSTWERWGAECALAGVLLKVALPRVIEYRARDKDEDTEPADDIFRKMK